MIDKMRLLKRQYHEAASAVRVAEEKLTEGGKKKASRSEIRVLHSRLDAARATLADVKNRLFDIWN